MRYLIVYISLMLAGVTAHAQRYQGSVSGNAMVYSIMSLDINQLGGNIAFNNANDYFNGVTENKYDKVKSF